MGLNGKPSDTLTDQMNRAEAFRLDSNAVGGEQKLAGCEVCGTFTNCTNLDYGGGWCWVCIRCIDEAERSRS